MLIKGTTKHSGAGLSLELLRNREIENAKLIGARGKADVEIGKLDWIQVGGHRTNNVNTHFLRGNDGEADLFTDGFLGEKIIEPLISVFDYA